MSFYLYCSRCHNTEFEVLYDPKQELFFVECNNPKCGWTAVVQGKYIMEEPKPTIKKEKPE